MTANNVLLHPRAGYLYADAASCHFHDGHLVQIVSKIFALPRANAAATFTGPPWRINELMARLAACEGGQALAERAPALVDDFWRAAEAEGVQAASVTIVIWRADLDTSTAMSFDLAKRDGGQPALLQAAPGSAAMRLRPSLDGEERAAVLALISNPSVFGEQALRRQRMRKRTFGNGGSFFAIGGFGEMAVVCADGVEVHRLVTWPEDRVGDVIDADGAKQVASRYSDELVVESLAIDNSAPSAPIVGIEPYVDPGHAGETRLRVTVSPTNLTPVRATFEYTDDNGETWSDYTPPSGPVNTIRLFPNVFDTDKQIAFHRGFRVTLYSSNDTPGATGQAILAAP